MIFPGAWLYSEYTALRASELPNMHHFLVLIEFGLSGSLLLALLLYLGVDPRRSSLFFRANTRNLKRLASKGPWPPNIFWKKQLTKLAQRKSPSLSNLELFCLGLSSNLELSCPNRQAALDLKAPTCIEGRPGFSRMRACEASYFELVYFSLEVH